MKPSYVKQLSNSDKMRCMSQANPIVQGIHNYFLKGNIQKKDDALESLIYGMEVNIINKVSGTVTREMLFLCDNNSLHVIRADKHKQRIARIDLTQISDITYGIGDPALKSKLNKKGITDDLCLNLHFIRANSIDLIFYTKDGKSTFLSGVLELLIDDNETEGRESDFSNQNKTNPCKRKKSAAIRRLFNEYEVDHSGKLEYNEFLKMVKRTNVANILFIDESSKHHTPNSAIYNSTLNSEAYLIKLFNYLDRDKSGRIEYEEFCLLYSQLTNGEEYKSIFTEFSRGISEMSLNDLVEFMCKEQGEKGFTFLDGVRLILDIKGVDISEAARNEATQLLWSGDKKRKLSESNEKEFKITLEEFKILMTCRTLSNVYNLELFETKQDMTLPLNNYFIFSSHNTYLTTHQLFGESDAEMYRFAVESGCRQVELDCWNGDNEPKITHGNTLTSDISFRSALQVLKEHSFTGNPYPVIISIEMHCNESNQQIMARLYREILVDVYALDPTRPPERYPSPEELKKMYVIKDTRDRIVRRNERYHTIEEDNGNILGALIKNDEFDYELKSNPEIFQGNTITYDTAEEVGEEISKNEKICVHVSPSIKIHQKTEGIPQGNVNKNTSDSMQNPFKAHQEEILSKTSGDLHTYNTIEYKPDEIEAESFVYNTNNKNKKLLKSHLSDIKEISMEHCDISSKALPHMFRDSQLTSSKNFESRFSSYEILEKESRLRMENREYLGKLSNEKMRNTVTYLAGKDHSTIPEIQELTGLIKLKFEMKKVESEFYQPWECPRINDKKMIEYCKNFEPRKKIVEFCKKSFLQVNPSTGRIESTNFDPVKAWICGVNFAAMNIQSLNLDPMLINKIFFKLNQNTGYVLKPSFLTKEGVYDRKYLNPVLRVTIELISGSFISIPNISLLPISISAYVIGSWEDDSFNTKYKTREFSHGNNVRVIFDMEKFIFDLYEAELSFIILKVQMKEEVIARTCVPLCVMKTGLRVLPLYDDLCNEIKDAELCARIKKIEL